MPVPSASMSNQVPANSPAASGSSAKLLPINSIYAPIFSTLGKMLAEINRKQEQKRNEEFQRQIAINHELRQKVNILKRQNQAFKNLLANPESVRSGLWCAGCFETSPEKLKRCCENVCYCRYTLLLTVKLT